jgi:hypothetical protein
VSAFETLNPPRNGEVSRSDGGVPSWGKTVRVSSWDPSVSPAGCHLPVPGRIFAVEAP